jgi:hypothetical protein
VVVAVAVMVEAEELQQKVQFLQLLSKIHNISQVQRKKHKNVF